MTLMAEHISAITFTALCIDLTLTPVSRAAPRHAMLD